MKLYVPNESEYYLVSFSDDFRAPFLQDPACALPYYIV